ncbi:MAG: MurT ligase domain-containing protein [Oscillospiraceae bacterium]|nr:MurT ligase domain-containing protein [Oscillospiraceae bacterium]
MKIFLAVFICKLLYFIGKRVGKGSSLPGKIVLRLFPDVLGRLRLPDTIIAVTGSNGKTTTTELIVHALEVNGMSVGWNYEGSNQTEGVATLLLRIASFGGVVKRDAIVMECDERYAKKIFENVCPSVLLVTNLCRDQLSRNGHHEFIEDCLRAAINVCRKGKTLLVLNADDPYVSALADGDVLWFGVGETESEADNTKVNGIYDDGAFCPVCKGRMTYSYRIAGHYGSYCCSDCGHKRNDPEIEVTMTKGDSTQGNGCLVFACDASSEISTSLNVKLPGVTASYNFCAAVAVAKASGISVSDSIRALDNYELKSGRVTGLSVNNRSGLLLLSKHENSFAYNASLSWVTSQNISCTVIILVDAISRKYYTSETSWLWDIDFDLLVDDNVKHIVLAGQYVSKLKERFTISAVDQTKIGYISDLNDLRGYIENNTSGEIYALTCFSDKAKLLNALGNL